MKTRRWFLAAAVFAPIAGFAHDGHDLSQLHVVIVDSVTNDAGLRLTARLTNGRDQPVALNAAYCDLGVVLANYPITVPVGEAVEFSLSITADQWPGIFTLVLDFGEAGFGPVTVVPSA